MILPIIISVLAVIITAINHFMQLNRKIRKLEGKVEAAREMVEDLMCYPSDYMMDKYAYHNWYYEVFEHKIVTDQISTEVGDK